jgi:hypothetical protein
MAGARARATTVSAADARAVDVGARATRAADVQAAPMAAARREAAVAGRPAAATDRWGPEQGLAALDRYHPELARGSRRPVTVYFVVDRSGSVRRSLTVPTEQGAAAGPGPEVFHTESSGGSAARAQVRSNPALSGIDPSTVESVHVWRGREIPRNVSVGWVILKD